MKWLIQYGIEVEADTWEKASEKARDYLYARGEGGNMVMFRVTRLIGGEIDTLEKRIYELEARV